MCSGALMHRATVEKGYQHNHQVRVRWYCCQVNGNLLLRWNVLFELGDMNNWVYLAVLWKIQFISQLQFSVGCERDQRNDMITSDSFKATHMSQCIVGALDTLDH